MSGYTIVDQETSDIDWFFTDFTNVGFVASAGGLLPKQVAMSRSVTESLAAYFSELPDTSDYKINEFANYQLKQAGQQPNNLDHLSYFIKMSQKGLFTYDKLIVNELADTRYYLVTTPTNPLLFQDLPHEIREVLLAIKTGKELTIIDILKLSEEF